MEEKTALPLEIERKFLIAMPDPAWLLAQPGARREELAQTYLESEPDEEIRVRKRIAGGESAYVRTIKRALGGAKRVEIETAITKAEYDALLLNADPALRTIQKTRHSFPFGGHTLEIDVYPFWRDRAILEIELTDEGEEIRLPGEICVIREVTDDPCYKNAALAAAQDLQKL